MEQRKLEVGNVVQLRPEHKFGRMLVVVIDPKEWGCQGYLMSQFNFEAVRFQGVAYVRPKFEDFEYVGEINWIYKHDGENS